MPVQWHLIGEKMGTMGTRGKITLDVGVRAIRRINNLRALPKAPSEDD